MILTAILFAQMVSSCAPGDSPDTLAAVASVESGYDTLAINDNTTRTRYAPASVQEAVETATRLLNQGHSLDLGLMQINSNNFPALGLSVEQSFDACRSIKAGARVLREGYQSALRVAFSRYNTGNDTKGFANGYVRKVLAAGGLPDMRGRVTVTAAPIATEQKQAPAPDTPKVVSDILHGIETPEETEQANGSGALDLFSGVSVPSGNRETANQDNG